MRFVAIDWETRFDSKSGYTLKKMTTEAYVRDARFKPHGCAVKWGADSHPRWYDARQAQFLFQSEDWSDTCIIHHHAHFDSLIESHHYNVRPKLIGCTLSMARMMLGNHLSVSLDSVRKHYGMPGKRTPYEKFDGRHWNELDRATQDEIAEGACDEVESIWTLFQRMLQDGFPVEELELIDITVRMFTEPVLHADVPALGKVWKDEQDGKTQRLADLDCSSDDLQSSDNFSDLLRAEGVGIAYKQGKNGPIPAFAKTDEFMQELLADENPRVRALAEARLGVKSTLKQTRAETLGWMASRGDLCVYLRPYAAHTTRFGGFDRANFQNNVEEINACIHAPEGYLLASPDASQIECRILNYVAGQEDVVEMFRQGLDVYTLQAQKFYGRDITRDERQIFKVVELQAGFGSGAAKIKGTIRTRAGIVIEDLVAEDLKTDYRREHDRVVHLWWEGDQMIKILHLGHRHQWGPVEIKDHRLILPNGTWINYEKLEWYYEEDGDGYWRLQTRRGWSKMYGAKLVENLIQALARVVVGRAMVRIARRGYKIFNMRHDDIGVLIPREGAGEHLQACIDELRAPVAWLPGCPLDAEGSLSERYE
jgi:DNA polymerase family A